MPTPPPRSCDTFVFVGGGASGPACTLFGKNSDRPSDEEHEVVYAPAAQHPEGSTVKCTYISIPQARSTLAVVLSKPRWLWGCEMGANEKGVVGGNEAVSSALSHELGSEARLLGMDLLRLALERGGTALEAAEACATLLEAHGQGGGCAEGDDWTYENGFLFADAREAYVLETAGVHHWALEKVTQQHPSQVFEEVIHRARSPLVSLYRQVAAGTHRNISNGLSIRTSVHSCSAGIKGLCEAEGWWDGKSQFDWKAAVGFAGRCAGRGLEVHGREKAARRALELMADEPGVGGAEWCRRAARLLRDEDSGICFRDLHGFNSTGSQISWLPDPDAELPPAAASHLFTGASDPMVATYKRFSFGDADAAAAGSSLELWREWRRVALRGGLERACPASSLSARREQTEQMENKALQAEAEAVRAAGGEGGAAPPTFAAAVARELGWLRAALGDA